MSIKATDHLANERTFLSWIRTSLGIMAFGFVVERFSFFTRQLAIYAGKVIPQGGVESSTALERYSPSFGMALIAGGALFSILVFFRFRKTEQQIEVSKYRSSIFLSSLLTFLVVLVGLFLVLYLAYTNVQQS